MKFTISKIIISIACIVLFWGIFFLFQNRHAYNSTLGKVTDNYERIDGVIYKVHKHYEQLLDSNLIHWDVGMYNNIRQNYYNIKISGGDYIYAVFPLFSIIWRFSHLSARGIVILNMLFFILSLIIISNLFGDPLQNKTKKLGLFAVAITFPTVVAFYIPYSESTFILMCTIAVWGLFKNKYWLYFIGMTLVAMTRSVIFIIFFTFIFTNILYLLKHRNFKFFIIETFKQTLPLFIGTFLVSLMQLHFGSGSLFKFLDAQKWWGNTFSIPYNLRDWSKESFGISVAVIVFLISTLIAYIPILIKNNISSIREEPVSIFSNEKFYIKDYLMHLSIIYFFGVFAFILFYRGGCMYGVGRYILCTPFFYIFFYSITDKLNSIPVKLQAGIWIALAWLSLFFVGLSTNAGKFDFYSLGYFLFVAATGIWLFNKYIPKAVFIPLVVLFVIISTVWTTYLFNMLLSYAWICI